MKPGTKRILKKFLNINTTRMRATVDVIAKNSGHSKPYIYCSMAWNFIKYRMGYTDYFRGNFIEITEAEKKTHVTAKSFYNVIHYFNDQRYVGIFTNKLYLSCTYCFRDKRKITHRTSNTLIIKDILFLKFRYLLAIFI